ncbi:pyruvate dehydrogenase protein x component [Terfezia claveryi]|nr:pyruvate dehydrogenase protein x component [Terfezia claveryi]
MPAMSPTMTEGNIASWKVKEGDKFRAGDVLLEIETDKAQIDVEAQEDGVMAKIFAGNGSKGIQIGSRIAVLAEPDDDLATLKIPDEPKAKSSAPAEPRAEDEPKATPPSPQPRLGSTVQAASPPSHGPKKHHRTLKEPFTPSPSVMALLHRNNLTKEDIPQIPATGPRGRLLKGDVLAYIGSISKDAPATLEFMIHKLAHLDLSNIKVKQAPAPAPVPSAGKGQSTSAKPPVVETDIQVEVSLDRLFKVQSAVQEMMGFSPPISAFLAEASRKASQNLPPSKLPATPNEILNELLGLPRKPVLAPYKPQLIALPTPSTTFTPASNKLDIIDILSGTKPKPVVRKVASVPAPAAVNVISVKVNPQDGARAKVFLDRVKEYIEADPGKLFASWGEGVKKSATASAELF